MNWARSSVPSKRCQAKNVLPAGSIDSCGKFALPTASDSVVTLPRTPAGDSERVGSDPRRRRSAPIPASRRRRRRSPPARSGRPGRQQRSPAGRRERAGVDPLVRAIELDPGQHGVARRRDSQLRRPRVTSGSRDFIHESEPTRGCQRARLDATGHAVAGDPRDHCIAGCIDADLRLAARQDSVGVPLSTPAAKRVPTWTRQSAPSQRIHAPTVSPPASIATSC